MHTYAAPVRILVILGTVAVLIAFDAGVAAAATCDSLVALNLPNTTITMARAVAAGTFTAPGRGGQGGAPMADLPAFCRVAATLRPTADSDIKIEVWLPESGWNGKFQAVGNGGWNGNIDINALAGGVRRGYAAASTDTGHEGGAGPWMLNQEKLNDWGYRSVHEMSVAGKAIVNAFYGNAPRFSYFTGCSAGGRQAMMEAQRYPGDFNGVVAGAPGLDWTSRAAQATRIAQVYQKDDASRIPPAKYAALNAAVLQACDARDGVTDGVLENPRACKFDPAVLACKAGVNDAACLAPAEVQTARAVYAVSINPKTRREISGLEPGSERGWTELGWSAGGRGNGLDYYRYVVFKDPQWDPARFNFDVDIVRAEDASAGINALDANLKPFFDRGGKLIQYHGWNDPQISPGNSVQYYQRVLDASGGAGRVQESHRLFMVPGMGHCGGGVGTSTFDMLAALEAWVEKGQAPGSIPASRVTDGRIDRTRPLCPYPQVATYRGSGRTDEAANFVCK